MPEGFLQGRRGNPVPPKLRAIAMLLAKLTFSSYPNTDKHLRDLEEGMYKPEAKDSYQYNIKSYQNRVQTKSKPANSMRKMSCDFSPTGLPGGLEDGKTKSQKRKFKFVTSQINYFKERFSKTRSKKLKEELWFDEQDEDRETKQEVRNRWKRGVKSAVESVHKRRTVNQSWGNLINRVIEQNSKDKVQSDFEKSDLLLQDEEVFWNEMDKMCRVVVEDSWRKFMSEMWEDRWRSEDGKEIIGEEWRKISRILDRYALECILE